MAKVGQGEPMQQRLADFIEANRRTIVDHSSLVAASFLSGANRSSADHLREHLSQMLDAVVKDLRTVQSRESTVERSQTPVTAPHTPDTAAGVYARLRAQSGITLEQVVAELRALRASVSMLWKDATLPDSRALDDLTRFNAAMDQILAESIANFSAEIEGWRDVFLGTLAHDLRGPLSVNVLTAEVLSRIIADRPEKLLVERLQRSAARMKALLDSLLDYSKASLGGGIRISPAHVDLDPGLRDEVDLLRALFQEHEISYESAGRTNGLFDVSRIREALANLVINAAKHGAAGGPIRITLYGDEEGARLVVKNIGPSLPGHMMSALFMPFGQLRDTADDRPEADSLGLGLFIVKQIALAHGGSVAATSLNGCTAFTITLPWRS
ncbi:HAMP domain-containing sensor histidine kinase [Lysobacter sp. LF1]|uniref:histidine kinase n=1 Tax=Lysobacter stagni TaxID=3045172 RepID=A0ABT6XER7_9GAMM|nr:HAMP domain-containing sensor histidine kinase [Lysobacter sp. LF1]MDI9238646.1 HAMP domain-containing sensor histidine kinase [Lysobacter sp. LF1]